MTPLLGEDSSVMLGAVFAAETLLARSQRRRHRLAHVVLAVVMICVVGLSLALFAGAHRSSTVVERFSSARPQYDLVMYSPSGRLERDVLQAYPQVERADASDYVPMTHVAEDGRIDLLNGLSYEVDVADPTVRLLAGRRPADVADEIAVNSAFVRRTGLTVGDTAEVVLFAPDQIDDVENGIYEPAGPHYSLRIVGVVRTADEVVADEVRAPSNAFRGNTDDLYVSVPNRFVEEHGSEYLGFGSSFSIRFGPGAGDPEAFVEQVRNDLGPDLDLITGPPDTDDRSAVFDTPVDLETSTLLAVAVGAAGAAIAVALLALRIQQRAIERDQQVVGAIGMSSSGVAATAAIRIGPTAVVASGGATLLAWILSERFPIGLGRQLELSPGRQADGRVLVLGGLAVCAVLTGAAALMALRQPALATVPRVRGGRSSAWPERLPFIAGLGVRLASGMNHRRAVTTLGVLAAGVACAVATMVGTWVSSTSRLYAEPLRRGWEWDAAVGNISFVMDPHHLREIAADPSVERQTAMTYGQLTLDDASVEVLAYDPNGTAPPIVLDGRLPFTAHEIALGAGLMRKMHKHIGDEVHLSLDGSEYLSGDRRPGTSTDLIMTVVGESVSPVFGEADAADIGVVTLDAISLAGGEASPRVVLVVVDSSDPDDAVVALSEQVTEEVHTEVIPGRIVTMYRARGVLFAGLVLAAATGVFVVISILTTLARANRKPLAVLSAIGLHRRQFAAAVACQAMVIAGGAIALGTVLGVVGGNILWRRVADRLGVPAMVDVPSALIGGGVALLAVALVVAMEINRTDRRRMLTDLLQSE